MIEIYCEVRVKCEWDDDRNLKQQTRKTDRGGQGGKHKDYSNIIRFILISCISSDYCNKLAVVFSATMSSDHAYDTGK